MIYLLIVYCLAFIVLTVLQSKWSLFLICLLLPTYQIRLQVFGLPTTLLEVMILILFIVWFFKFQIYRLSGIRHLVSGIQSWFWSIYLWLAIGLIAVFVSPDKWAAFGHWRAYFLEPVMLLVVFLDLKQRDINMRVHTDNTNFTKVTNLILFGLSISVLYCSVWAICQKWLGGGVWSLETWGAAKIWRATGPFPQPNFLGLYLAPIIILAIGQLISNLKFQISKLTQLFVICYLLLVIIASLLAIIFARSEGAILGLVAGLIFGGLIYKKSRKRVVIALVILLILSFTLPQTRNYLIPKFTFQDLSSQLRLNIWRGTIELIKDHPIFGVGLRGYQKLISQYQKPYYHPQTHQLISVETHPYPHNLFLAIWVESGIPGLVVFLIIIFQFFKLGFRKLFGNLKLEIKNSELVKNEKILIVAILSAMVTILIHGIVDTPYFKNDLAILFWLIVGLLTVDKSKVQS